MPAESKAVEAVTGKLGPLPVWAWALAVSVPIIVAKRVIASRKAAADAAAEAAAAADQSGQLYATPTTVPGGIASGALYPLGNPGGDYSGGSTYTGGAGSSDTPAASSAPTTNSQWRNLAADKLVATGDFSGSVVLDALTRVLSGQPVTSQQEAIFNMAVRIMGGNPPEGIPTITRVPDPPPPVASPPPAQTTPPPTPATPAPVVTPAPATPAPAEPAVDPAIIQGPLTGPPPAGAKGYDGGPLVWSTVRSGESFYAMGKRVIGRPLPAETLAAIAEINGFALGPPPNYVPTVWRPGQYVRFN